MITNNNSTIGLWISVVCGICLLAIVIALIFKDQFRKDLAAQPGKLTFLGASVEGVIVVMLCVLFVGGLIFPFSKQEKPLPSPPIDHLPKFLESLPFKVTDSDDAMRQIKDLSEARAAETPNLITLLDKVSPDDENAAAIRQLAKEQKGPWGKTTKARAFLITVPGNFKDNVAGGCSPYVGSEFDLSSNYRFNDELIVGETATRINVTTTLLNAMNCEELYPFFQVSCQTANKVFSSSVVTCDEKGNPGWKPDVKERKLPVFITKVISGKDGF